MAKGWKLVNGTRSWFEKAEDLTKDKCKIYKITCLENNKVYIGQTWQAVNTRWRQHYSKTTSCIKLGYAIEKYGKENFSIDVLAVADDQITADELESYYINLYDTINTGYNLKEGGSAGRHTEETKKKLSEMKTNPSDEVRKNLSDSHKGYVMPEETKKKMSESHLGHEVSEETREKLSIANKGKTIPQETRDKIAITLTGRKIPHVMTDEGRQKIINNNKNRGVSEETKKKMSDAHKGQRAGAPSANKGKTWKIIDGKRIWMDKQENSGENK